CRHDRGRPPRPSLRVGRAPVWHDANSFAHGRHAPNRAYEEMVPVCKELATGAGYIGTDNQEHEAAAPEFTFGLVEVALYRHPDIGLLVQPRVIARTVEFKRIVIELPERVRVLEAAEGETAEEAPSESQLFYTS